MSTLYQDNFYRRGSARWLREACAGLANGAALVRIGNYSVRRVGLQVRDSKLNHLEVLVTCDGKDELQGRFMDIVSDLTKLIQADE